jgi:hypothetical protein
VVCLLFSSFDVDSCPLLLPPLLCQRAANVEVIMLEPQMPEIVGSVDSATSASSAAADAATLAERAISALPLELAADVVDPKRKARSQDPVWKYGWWPDPTKKDFLQCIFCMKVVPAGIKRFKQHLAGGYGDTIKCVKVPELISREMHAYFKKNSKVVINLDDGGEQRNADGPQPSSGTKYKQARKKVAQPSISYFVVSATTKPSTQKESKLVSGMLSKTPEEVVAERHKSSTSQSTLEHCTKKERKPNKSLTTMLLISFMRTGYLCT